MRTVAFAAVPRKSLRLRRLAGLDELADYGVGTTGNWGGHGIDQVQCALGTDDTGPVEVIVGGPALVPPVYSQPEDPTRGSDLCPRPLISFRYASGTVLELGGGSISGAIFEGEKGKIEIRRGSLHSNPTDLIENVELPPSRFAARAGSYRQLAGWHYFPAGAGRRRRGGTPHGHDLPPGQHRPGFRAYLRRDSAAERFIGDDEANGLLDRPRRPGYELPEKI